MTIERYTGNLQGSQENWPTTTETLGIVMDKGMDKTLPGLDDVYMARQWVEPGGCVPTVAVSGRAVIKMICKKGKRTELSTSLPAKS
jgi:phytoene dehydrogenase-like protein